MLNFGLLRSYVVEDDAVNLLLSPTDFSDSVWNPYPEHSFVDNGDGSQTIIQSQGGSAWDSYMFSKQSTYNHVNLVQDQEYVFRIRMKTDLETYILYQ